MEVTWLEITFPTERNLMGEGTGNRSVYAVIPNFSQVTTELNGSFDSI